MDKDLKQDELQINSTKRLLLVIMDTLELLDLAFKNVNGRSIVILPVLYSGILSMLNLPSNSVNNSKLVI